MTWFTASSAWPKAMGSPNFESSRPVVTLAWVWASTSGATRSRTACLRPAAAAAAAVRPMSAKFSTTTRPTPASAASRSSAGSLLLPTK